MLFVEPVRQIQFTCGKQMDQVLVPDVSFDLKDLLALSKKLGGLREKARSFGGGEASFGAASYSFSRLQRSCFNCF